jgi:hypothetical protein
VIREDSSDILELLKVQPSCEGIIFFLIFEEDCIISEQMIFISFDTLFLKLLDIDTVEESETNSPFSQLSCYNNNKKKHIKRVVKINQTRKK